MELMQHPGRAILQPSVALSAGAGDLYVSILQEDLHDGEIEYHAHKRWVRIGRGRRRAEAERLAFAVHQVAKTMWMGRGTIRVRLRDGMIEFKGERAKCAQAIADLWYGCPMLSTRD
jgi:hypothetical protein